MVRLPSVNPLFSASGSETVDQPAAQWMFFVVGKPLGFGFLQFLGECLPGLERRSWSESRTRTRLTGHSSAG